MGRKNLSVKGEEYIASFTAKQAQVALLEELLTTESTLAMRAYGLNDFPSLVYDFFQLEKYTAACHNLRSYLGSEPPLTYHQRQTLLRAERISLDLTVKLHRQIPAPAQVEGHIDVLIDALAKSGLATPTPEKAPQITQQIIDACAGYHLLAQAKSMVLSPNLRYPQNSVYDWLGRLYLPVSSKALANSITLYNACNNQAQLQALQRHFEERHLTPYRQRREILQKKFQESPKKHARAVPATFISLLKVWPPLAHQLHLEIAEVIRTYPEALVLKKELAAEKERIDKIREHLPSFSLSELAQCHHEPKEPHCSPRFPLYLGLSQKEYQKSWESLAQTGLVRRQAWREEIVQRIHLLQRELQEGLREGLQDLPAAGKPGPYEAARVILFELEKVRPYSSFLGVPKNEIESAYDHLQKFAITHSLPLQRSAPDTIPKYFLPEIKKLSTISEIEEYASEKQSKTTTSELSLLCSLIAGVQGAGYDARTFQQRAEAVSQIEMPPLKGEEALIYQTLKSNLAFPHSKT